MKKNKRILSIVLFIICAVAIILLFNAESLFLNSVIGAAPFNGMYEQDTSDMSGVVVEAKSGRQSCMVKVYTAESGEKYLFLPAWTEKISFVNLADKCEIVIEKEKVKEVKDIPVGSDFIVSLLVDGEKSDELMICKSENIGALFIDCEVEQELLDAVNGEKYGAKCHLYDNAGNTLANERLEYIRTRGNTTFDFDKKAYEIKFLKDRDLLNGGNASEWVLLANDYDKSLLRNRMVNLLAEKYTDNMKYPLGDYVDVYINGDYRGNYFMCTKPHKSGQSIKLTDLDKLNEQVNKKYTIEDLTFGFDENGTAYGVTNLKSYENITGGYLVELMPKYQLNSDDAWFETNSGFIAKLRAPRYATLEEVKYIRDYFNELEEAASSTDGINKNTGKTITDYLDVDSYTTRYFIDLLFADADSNQASSFFYKDADEVDGRIHAGPLWDYDQTLYNGQYYNMKMLML